MKRIYRSQSSLDVAHMRNVLIAAGIQAQIRNEFLQGAMGELPLMETWPQLWVDDIDEPRALRAISSVQNAAAGTPWICTCCGERLEPQFMSCWHCGTERYETDH
jgi:hypothetical protein